MTDLKEFLDSGKEFVIYLQSKAEFSEFAEIWSDIHGVSVDHEFLTERAENADLCLHLKRRGGRYNWTWSDKEYCFVDHPEIAIHTMDDLRIKPSDLGEIEVSEADVFALFLEVIGGD